MTEDRLHDFKSWLLCAKPGERFVYLSDVYIIGDRSDLKHKGENYTKVQDQIRREAWKSYESGLVHLFQRRRRSASHEHAKHWISSSQAFDYEAVRVDSTAIKQKTRPQ
jgi:hypothetical protein